MRRLKIIKNLVYILLISFTIMLMAGYKDLQDNSNIDNNKRPILKLTDTQPVEQSEGNMDVADISEIIKPITQPEPKPTPKPTQQPAATTTKKTTSAPKPPVTNPSACPVSTQNCVPCVAGEPYCRTLSGAATGYKGWACQNNNPGNIRYYASSSDPLLRIRLITQYGGKAPCGEKATYMVFSDYTTGRNALKAYIKAINDGKHTAYPQCGNCSLKYFFSKYAPAGDQNDPNSYSNKVAGWIGENADTTTLDFVVKNKLEAFVDAIQRMEGFFVQ